MSLTKLIGSFGVQGRVTDAVKGRPKESDTETGSEDIEASQEVCTAEVSSP